MVNKNIIDIAYHAVSEINKKEKKNFSFEEILHSIESTKLYTMSQIKEQLGEIYTGLSQDKRFILNGEGKWELCENLTIEQITQISNAMYEAGLYKDNDEEEQDEETRKQAQLNKEKEEEESSTTLDEFVYDEDEEDDQFSSNSKANSEFEDELEEEEEEEEEE